MTSTCIYDSHRVKHSADHWTKVVFHNVNDFHRIDVSVSITQMWVDRMFNTGMSGPYLLVCPLGEEFGKKLGE